MILSRQHVAAFVFLAMATGSTWAVELLTDGGFEYATAIPGWQLEESIYDQTTMMPRDLGDTNSAQQQTFGPVSGDYALWLRAFVGGQAAGPDALTNASLSQTVPANVGESYSFTGWSRWEVNYSGGANTLSPAGPLGGVASPTETTMQLSFLRADGSVIQSTESDLRTEQNNFDVWREHTIVETAPAETARVRISADATAMLWNGGGSESAFYDNFSLTTELDPETELLANPDLEDVQPAFDPAWIVTEVPGGGIPFDPTVSTADFANRPDSGGQLGAWLRSFTGNAEQPADAILTQTVPGIADGEYTFSGWSNFQPNYPGGDSSFDTQTIMEMAFLDGSGIEIGEPLMLDLFADGQTNGSGWKQHTLNGTAPAGTESVRVMAAGLAMESNPLGGQQSAFLDDFSLDGPAIGGGVDGDFNDDGFWNCEDIDALTSAIAAGSSDLAFDMNGDGSINLLDVTDPGFGWLTVGGANNPSVTDGNPFLSGDANLDGSVDVSDFNRWNGNKFTSAAWCSGDFNADGSIDVSDFNVWNGNKFNSSSDASAVPEPNAAIVMAGLCCGLLVARNRRVPGPASPR